MTEPNSHDARQKVATDAAARLVERIVQKARADNKHGGDFAVVDASGATLKPAHVAPWPKTLSVEAIAALEPALDTTPVPMLYGKILLDADPGGGVKLRTERPSYLSRLLEQQPPGKLRFFAGFVAAHPAPGEPAPEQNPEDIAVGIVLGCIERAWAKAEDDGKAKAEAEAAAKKK